MHESDGQFKYLMSALYTPLDGTAYEDGFVGWNEVPAGLPITNLSWLSPLREEEFPQSDRLVECTTAENRFRQGTGPTYAAVI